MWSVIRIENARRFTGQFVGLIAKESRHRPIASDDPAAAGQNDADRRRVEDGQPFVIRLAKRFRHRRQRGCSIGDPSLEILLILDDLLLRLLLCGDVVPDDVKQILAALPYRGQQNAGDEMFAIGPNLLPFEFRGALLESLCDDFTHPFARRAPVRLAGRRNVLRSFADELVEFVDSERGERRGVCRDESTVFDQQERLSRVLEDFSESFLGFPQT
jgi:hypothetical protein